VPSVLFLCTGNSCRSILAEALWREETSGTWHCVSAGTHPVGSPHPLAIAVLEEDQIQVDELQSQAMEDLNSQQFDLAVTVCDAARQHCPVYANATRTLHWPFPDPATHSEDGEITQQGLAVFRTARDAIRKRIQRHLLASDLIDRLDNIIEQLPGEIPEERRLAYGDLARRCAGALDEGHPWTALPEIVLEVMSPFGWDWNGIYLLRGEIPGRRLELAYAAGPPVCNTIQEQQGGASGMCFDAIEQGSILVAADVDRWPGYIRCDGESGLRTVAGIARPIFDESGEVVAVWDLDASEAVHASDALVMDALIERLGADGPPAVGSGWSRP